MCISLRYIQGKLPALTEWTTFSSLVKFSNFINFLSCAKIMLLITSNCTFAQEIKYNSKQENLQSRKYNFIQINHEKS
jgi:hypothetical protein